jgi:hypothetical protein
MRAEKARGVTFVVLAGAEPALVPELCRVCYAEMPLGTIATNGLVRIPEDIGYRLHISIWGNDDTSRRIRGAKDMLAHQLDNYRDDPRAVFVYTFTPDNIDEAHEVVATLAEQNARVTFNMFSAPVGYTGPLRHTPDSLQRVRETMLQMTAAHPRQVLFSAYNAMVHTHRLGLHDLFAYAAGSAIVTAKLFRHATDPVVFRAWLDYVDTYLAVWVTGYEKGVNLSAGIPAPPCCDA